MRNVSIAMIAAILFLTAFCSVGGSFTAMLSDQYVNLDTGRRVCVYKLGGAEYFQYISPGLTCEITLTIEK